MGDTSQGVELWRRFDRLWWFFRLSHLQQGVSIKARVCGGPRWHSSISSWPFHVLSHNMLLPYSLFWVWVLDEYLCFPTFSKRHQDCLLRAILTSPLFEPCIHFFWIKIWKRKVLKGGGDFFLLRGVFGFKPLASNWRASGFGHSDVSDRWLETNKEVEITLRTGFQQHQILIGNDCFPKQSASPFLYYWNFQISEPSADHSRFMISWWICLFCSTWEGFHGYIYKYMIYIYRKLYIYILPDVLEVYLPAVFFPKTSVFTRGRLWRRLEYDPVHRWFRSTPWDRAHRRSRGVSASGGGFVGSWSITMFFFSLALGTPFRVPLSIHIYLFWCLIKRKIGYTVSFVMKFCMSKS